LFFLTYIRILKTYSHGFTCDETLNESKIVLNKPLTLFYAQIIIWFTFQRFIVQNSINPRYETTQIIFFTVG